MFKLGDFKVFLGAFGLASICLIAYKWIMSLCGAYLPDDYIQLFWPLDNIVYIIRTFNSILHQLFFLVTGCTDYKHVIFVSPIIEEIEFRLPILYSCCKSKKCQWTVAFFSTILFALCHHAAIPFVCLIFIISSISAYLTIRTRCIIWSILFHALCNSHLLSI
jgi:membrane protease YdiL (CAAX protease family)